MVLGSWGTLAAQPIGNPRPATLRPCAARNASHKLVVQSECHCMAQPSTTTPTEPPDSGQLAGWKEIAAFFGKSARTAQRWEIELGLPVRRINTGRGETVYALVAELESWRSSLEARKLADGWDRDEQSTPEGADGSQPGATLHSSPRRLSPMALAAVIGVALIAWSGVWYFAIKSRQAMVSSGAGSGPDAAPASHQKRPADYRVDLDTLVVLDGKKQTLWVKRFEAPLNTEDYGAEARKAGVNKVLLEDLDGNGIPELLFMRQFAQRPLGGDLFCFDADEKLRFSLPTPSRSVRFGDVTYAPPWDGYRLIATGKPGSRVVWAVWVHQSGEFPCLVQRVSMAGQVLSEYWSAGYVETIVDAVIDGRPVVLVGAANNDHNGASLAVFPADGVRGSAPAKTHDKTCLDCGPGGPLAVLVFPRSGIPRVCGNVPGVTDVRQDRTGRLRITVADTGSYNGVRYGGDVSYFLDGNLQPNAVEFSDAYITSHRLLRAAGLMDHPFGDEDRREAWPVLIWKGGWTLVQIPPNPAK
jgi:hypothetical protein